ncbi:unnamed protein product [Schistosoma margrebowiei]|uniref:Uncharacterized protein n=1 Tax=Schistosoma margrebowiei TaxID=48269 RepID=A0A183L889_9TREM|nr:unnamed protein product [Schistosoma margrebowiei]
MVVGGNSQETLNPGFVLFGTRQQGVPVILRELVLYDGFNPMSETLDLGFVLHDTCQQGIPVILRGPMLPDGFDPMSPSFTVRDIITGLSWSQMISNRTGMYLLTSTK